MAPTILTAQVGDDGVLKLNVPLGSAEANKTVRIVVESLAQPRATTREEWLQFLAEVGGSITDPTFQYHPVGPSEEREWEP
jgi:hypothetical protein